MFIGNPLQISYLSDISLIISVCTDRCRQKLIPFEHFLYIVPKDSKLLTFLIAGTIGDAVRQTSSPQDLFIDWCGRGGCDSQLQAGVTLRQKISQPGGRQEEIMNMCADLKLNQDKELEYTLVDCEDRRKPLCMRGEPRDISITESQARFRKKRRLKKKKIYKLRQKQLMAKAIKKAFIQKHKRRRPKRQAQASAPPVEMCATAGLNSISRSNFGMNVF